MTAYQRLPSASHIPVTPAAADREASRATVALDLAWFDPSGRATWDRRHLPDTPEVTGAVASLARGAMLKGTDGPIAVEDLMPGDEVSTQDGETVRIDWIGSRTYAPSDERPTFYRVTARAFGPNGPEADVMLGARAHVLIEHRLCYELLRVPRAFAPVAALEDGHLVSAVTPPGEVTVYGIACSGQSAVMVSGLAVESYHPARATGRSLNRTVLSDMARLFPQIGDGDGFGPPRIPYLSASEAHGLAMAIG
ncbi:Hint domain-containing protein [uncultured Jannaschia sp.]|uniref:Hint domain-containing protein n=1 Tax=uncultured Jannaschia sp. TaxID=293347 RepID=UPI0026347C79|nr:Hint domain-containing protein [uncultured Jannaschia sp.]